MVDNITTFIICGSNNSVFLFIYKYNILSLYVNVQTVAVHSSLVSASKFLLVNAYFEGITLTDAALGWSNMFGSLSNGYVNEKGGYPPEHNN